MLPTIVTAVIPCFNATATLEAAVASVLAQGDIGVEIVLVDDCSTDGKTLEMCQALAARHRNVAVLRHIENAAAQFGARRLEFLRHVADLFRQIHGLTWRGSGESSWTQLNRNQR